MTTTCLTLPMPEAVAVVAGGTPADDPSGGRTGSQEAGADSERNGERPTLAHGTTLGCERARRGRSGEHSVSAQPEPQSGGAGATHTRLRRPPGGRALATTTSPHRYGCILVLTLLLAGTGCGARRAAAIRAAAPETITTTAVTSVVPTTRTTTPPPVTAPRTTATTLGASGSGISGRVLFSPVCPVEGIPADPGCAPRPGPAHVVLVRTDDGTTLSTQAGASGEFSLSVAPGTYVLKVVPLAPGPGRGCQANPAEVRVTRGATATVEVICDTGIR